MNSKSVNEKVFNLIIIIIAFICLNENYSLANVGIKKFIAIFT